MPNFAWFVCYGCRFGSRSLCLFRLFNFFLTSTNALLWLRLKMLMVFWEKLGCWWCFCYCCCSFCLFVFRITIRGN